MAVLVPLSVRSVEAQGRRAEALIEAGPNHIVSVPKPGMSRNEVWLAASRKDPNTFVAVFHASGNVIATGCESAVSKDGGQSWRRFKLADESDCFDPMVVSGGSGQFYVSYSAWRAPNPEFGAWRGVSAPIRIYTSLDDGDSWSAPLNLITPLRPDHQRKAVDLSGGPFNGRVYISWVEFPAPTVPGKYHLFLHYLDPEGKTQSEPHLVHITDEARPDALEPVVLSDGTLLLPMWYQPISMLSTYYPGNAGVPLDPGLEHQRVYLIRSSDGGQSFGSPEKVIEVGVPVWRTRLHRFLSSQANPPIFTVDASKTSRYRDRIYAVWNDTRAGATTDIWLIWSADGGHTWSAPVRVNDFAAPYRETEPPDVRLTPVVAVNRDGIVAVAWYDRREDPTRRCWKQYFSASLDGGQTFLKNEAISTAASCPPLNKPPIVDVYNERSGRQLPSWDELRLKAGRIDEVRRNKPEYDASVAMTELEEQAKARVRADAGLTATSRMHISFDPARSEFLGHYSGLAPSTDGSFLAVWADGRRGDQEIYGARVNVVVGPQEEPRLEGRKLNDAVDVIVDEVSYDEAAGLTTMQVKLHNRSDRAIYPPLVLRVREVIVGNKNVAANADKESHASGAEWDFSRLLGTQNRLEPGMISEPHTLKLRSSAEHGLDVILDYDVVGKSVVSR